MGIFDKSFKSKEAIAFEQAFEQALLEIRKAISLYNQDNVCKKQIDDALNMVNAQMDNALNVVKSIPNKEDRMMILRFIAFVQSRLGNIELAIEIAQGIKNKDHCSGALRSIAATQADNLEGAIETLQKMPQKGLLSETLRDISVAQALSGDVEHAIKTAQNIPKAGIRQQILELIEFAKSGSTVQQAVQQAANKVLTPQEATGLFSRVAFRNALSGNIKLAIKTAQDIPNQRVCSDFLYVLAMGYVWLGEVEQAIEIAQKIPDKIARSMTLGGVITSHAMTQALPIDQAIKIAQEISDESLRSAF